jgi:hypothetical protein
MDDLHEPGRVLPHADESGQPADLGEGPPDKTLKGECGIHAECESLHPCGDQRLGRQARWRQSQEMRAVNTAHNLPKDTTGVIAIKLTEFEETKRRGCGAYRR